MPSKDVKDLTEQADSNAVMNSSTSSSTFFFIIVVSDGGVITFGWFPVFVSGSVRVSHPA